MQFLEPYKSERTCGYRLLNNHNEKEVRSVSFGLFLCENGKSRTGTAVDAGNFRYLRRVAKDKMLFGKCL